jgi:Family of unknown function (DUF6481)
MASYKDPGFQDRIKLAAEAKQKALEKLRNKPPLDEAVIAVRLAAAETREAAAAEKRAARKAALAAKVAEKSAAKPAAPTPEEQKAARDARYAARKAGR